MPDIYNEIVGWLMGLEPKKAGLTGVQWGNSSYERKFSKPLATP